MLAGAHPWPPEFAARYRAEGYWTGETLADLGRNWARADGMRTAIVGGERRVGYAELDRRADELAAGLAELGLCPGDRAIVQLPNTVAFVEVTLALFRLGVVPVFALPAHRALEIGSFAELTGARAYFGPAEHGGFDYRALAREVAANAPDLEFVVTDGDPGEHLRLADLSAQPRPLPSPRGEDVAFLLLSGGTTDVPKLIPRTHDDYACQLRACAEVLSVDQNSVYLAALPAGHNAALGCPGVLGTLRAGGRVVLSPTPSPDDALPLIEAEGVTLTTLMPSLLPVWFELAPLFGADLKKVLLEVGGAALRPELAREMTDAGCRITQWFGMAEGVLCCTRLDAPADTVATTQGTPLFAADELMVLDEDGNAVAPGEEGELLYRGPCTLRGYYRADAHNARSFTPDGFFRTGDLVRLTPRGELQVTGRIKDIVNRGGEKVGAQELEALLERHPGVATAAVVAEPDPGLGERIRAFVVPAAAPPKLEELRTFLHEQGAAAYKLPDRLDVVAELPMTGAQKIDKKRLLREARP
ncbi:MULTISPECIES: (2,3-dihydroxybenzoyl)adenylate synthase [Amycolatopsis]|uniref:(2,3-dihydroxybenzoyl)adenylate synthase n=2 Tax=Amycolatopsis TaxID=1813 RepID=A0ABW5I769_9PSEU